MSEFQIIIPMSGFGERFRRAGYALPKPLIEVDGKPIIAHIIDLFPDEPDFIFICNQEHLDSPKYRLRETLQKYCPKGRIIGIAPHKLGPVHAVLQIKDVISLTKKTIVNYCDFSCYWHWQDFKQFVCENKCVGAIPAYKGFHPHSLGNTNYAYMLEESGWVKDIQEKQPYTNNRMNEYASSGTYYFATGQIMLTAFQETVAAKRALNGEFYVSLAYKALLEKKLPVAIYPIEYFMQWGTPEDLKEYQSWSQIFSQLLQSDVKPSAFGTLIMPMAGLGQRFINEGYTQTKPLIMVSGKAMVIQAAYDLPQSKNHVFILRADMPGLKAIIENIKFSCPSAIIKIVDQVTDGQASTTLIGLEVLIESIGNPLEPVTIGACDNGALYDRYSFDLLQRNPDIDVIVWGARGHPNASRNPQMYGWINANSSGKIGNISVKIPLGSPASDPIVVGTFTFRRASDLKNAIKSLQSRQGMINGEYYLDSCINDAIELGLFCQLFEVDHYISWGTPNDLKTFEYWQACFSKWKGHAYTKEKDRRFSN